LTKRKNIPERTRKKFRKIRKRDGDIPHRFHDTNLENLEEALK